jgi:hypothetical protein
VTRGQEPCSRLRFDNSKCATNLHSSKVCKVGIFGIPILNADNFSVPQIEFSKVRIVDRFKYSNNQSSNTKDSQFFIDTNSSAIIVRGSFTSAIYIYSNTKDSQLFNDTNSSVIIARGSRTPAIFFPGGE